MMSTSISFDMQKWHDRNSKPCVQHLQPDQQRHTNRLGRLRIRQRHPQRRRAFECLRVNISFAAILAVVGVVNMLQLG